MKWRSAYPSQVERDDVSQPVRRGRARFNTACDPCRRSKVKCSGDSPCTRCTISETASSCIYSISLRRGKHRAVPDKNKDSQMHHPLDAVHSQTGDTLNHADLSMDSYWASSFPDVWLSADQGVETAQLPYAPLSMDVNTVAENTGMADDLTINDVSTIALEPIFNMLDAPTVLPGSSEAPASSSSSAEASVPSWPTAAEAECSDATSCVDQIHRVIKQLGRVEEYMSSLHLAEIMSSFDQASSWAAKYSTCQKCEAGCRRLMNLAMLHQQVGNTFSELAKVGPNLLARCQDPISLSGYKASKHVNFQYKRSMLQILARTAISELQDFRDKVQETEDKSKDGSLKIAGSGRHTMDWLLSMGVSLTERMRQFEEHLGSDAWDARRIVDEAGNSHPASL